MESKKKKGKLTEQSKMMIVRGWGDEGNGKRLIKGYKLSVTS